MYRMLFVLFIEARPELGYVPINEQVYASGYSLESLRDIAESIRNDTEEVGEGFYLYETLSKLYELIYTGYPKTESLYSKVKGLKSVHNIFVIPPLKAHIFDPEYTPMLVKAKIRNSVMLRIIDLMSLTKSTGKKVAVVDVFPMLILVSTKWVQYTRLCFRIVDLLPSKTFMKLRKLEIISMSLMLATSLPLGSLTSTLRKNVYAMNRETKRTAPCPPERRIYLSTGRKRT